MHRASSSSAVYPVSIQHRPVPAPVRRFRPAMLALSMAAAFASLPLASQNLPQGNVNVVGKAVPVTTGKQMVVTTTNGAGGNHSATNWQSFSIGAGYGVRIDQPNAASLSINRVVTNAPSQIFGTLGSNGKLVLVNQSGITVGAGAVVDTAGFTASVLGMSDADALAGRIRFNADGFGQASGALRVEGNIIARGGDVVLIAPDIHVAKTAVVEAENGTAILAAGQRVEVTGRGLEGIVLQVQAPTDRAINLGTLKGDAVGIFAGQLRHSGIIQARGVSLEGGRVVLRAMDLAEVNGSIQASRTINGQTTGGSVEISAGHIASINGSIDVRGSSGGAVTVAAQNILQGGQVDASGTAGGGSIQLVARDYVEQTASAQVRADGGAGAGGAVLVQATGDNGTVLSSATLSADGAQGGSIAVAAPVIRLQAATVSAEGTATVNGGGGSIKVGGGRQGNDPSVPNSQNVFINNATVLSASSRRSGKGGTVIVWSDGITRFAGDAFARGGSDAGDGGFIEVSGKERLVFSGMANAGAPHGANGTLLLDPKNIIVDTATGGSATGLDPDPEPMGSSGDFGAEAFVMDGKLVITDPLNDVGGADAGAIYVFDPVTGGLLGSLKGSHANDRIGATSDNSPFNPSQQLLFRAPGWDGNKGAVTFFTPGTYTGSAVVSSANSYVGVAAGDRVGDDSPEIVNGIGGKALLFGTPDWGGGKGAIFKVFSGDTVRSGEVTAATALVGKVAGDRLGEWGSDTGDTVLSKAFGDYNYYYTNGQNQFLLSYAHFDGNRGAVTLGDITAPLVGEVGGLDAGSNPLNFSLRGANANDYVGWNVTELNPNAAATDWMISSPYWAFESGKGNAGALSFIRASDAGNFASLSNGLVSQANSMVSDKENSYYGETVYMRSGLSYFLIVSSGWNGNRGAVTWSSLAAPKTGVVSDTNSLVGALANSEVGYQVYPLSTTSQAQFIIASPYWDNNSTGTLQSDAGAITVIGNSDITGFVGAGNSFVGTHTGDNIGINLRDYSANVAVGQGSIFSVAPNWDGGKGAITRIDLGGPTFGEVGSGNSLVGTLSTDHIGERIIDNSARGYMLSVASNWGGGKGAVTFVKIVGPTVTGEVGAGNSLVGGTTLDHIGGSISKESTPFYSYSDVQDGTGVELLQSSHDYLVRVPGWDNSRGLVAYGNEINGLVGELSVANAPSIALVGAAGADTMTGYEGDRLGSRVATNADGSYVVFTPTWNVNRGAVTWGARFNGVQGNVSASNSLYGTTLSYFGANLTDFGNFYGSKLLAITPNWDDGKGALTVLGRAAPANLGAISAANSVVGSVAGDYLGCVYACSPSGGTLSTVQELGGNWWGVGSPNWGYGAGAITFIYTGAGSTANDAAAKAPTGTLSGGSSTNLSLLGGHGTDTNFDGDQYGLLGQVMPREYAYYGGSDGSGKVAVVNSEWAYGRGAVTMLDLNRMSGSVVVGQLNSLVGVSGDVFDDGGYLQTSGDRVGSSSFWSNDRQRLIVHSPDWNNGSGAVAVTDWTEVGGPPLAFGNIGQVSSTTAFVGDVSGDMIGGSQYGDYGMVNDLGNGKLLVVSSRWNNAKGAVTVLDLGAVHGTVDSTPTGNSMVGEADGDSFGEGATVNHIAKVGSKLVLASPGWKGGYGAITWIDMNSPGGTMSSATNSLVGSSSSDQVGSGGLIGQGTAYDYAYGDISSGYLNVTLALSPEWGVRKGAITLLTETPKTGTLSSSNSFVGDISSGEGTGDYVGRDMLYCGEGCYVQHLDVFGNGAVMMRTNRTSDSQSYLTLFTPDSTFTGTLNSTSSMQFGTNELDNALDNRVQYGDKIMLLMPDWNGDRGAIRVIDTAATLSGDITRTATANTGVTSAANALVGSTEGDKVGSGFENTYYYYNQPPYSPAAITSGRYLVVSPYWDGNKGAVTEFDLGASPVVPIGVLSSGNSLVGSTANDFGGVTNYAYEDLSSWVHRFTDGSYLLANQYFGGGQGSITYMQSNSALNKGVLGATNSLVGGAGNTDGSFNFYGRGNSNGYGYQSWLVVNDGWMGNRGMATVFNQGTAGNPMNGPGNPVGAITELNSLVGSAPDDRVGESVYLNGLGDGEFIVASENWNNARGAITWGQTVAGVTSLARGAVSASNSLVGSHDGDRVGDGLSGEGTTSPVGRLDYTTDRYYVITTNYNNGLGAYTFVNKGQTGTINDGNSVVGTYAGGLDSGYYGFPYEPQYIAGDGSGNNIYLLRFGGYGVGADGPGQVYLTGTSLGGGNAYGGNLGFGDAPDQTVTITPDRITSIVNTGTDIILQANNDIDIRSDIVLVSEGAGTMVFEAGRSIYLNANISTSGGDLGLFANSPNANPAYRDAGPGGIFTPGSASIDLGGGAMIAEVGTGAGGAQGGVIELGNIHHGAGLLARNLSTSDNAGIVQVPGAVWDVQKLAMETHGNNGNIGTLGQAIAFTGDELAVRTANGPADIHHLGESLYFTTLDFGGGSEGTLAADPGYRGIILGGAGSLKLQSEGDIFVLPGETPVSIEAQNVVIHTPNGGLMVSASYAAAEIKARGELQLTLRDDLTVHGGSGDGAHASIVSNGDATIVVGGIVNLHGGSGNNSHALLDPVFPGSTMYLSAVAVNLTGGSGANAYAAIVSQGGDIELRTESLQMVAGSGSNADAVILAPNGEALSAAFGRSYLGVGDARANGVADTGFGTIIVASDVLSQQFLADQNLMTDFLNNYNDELLRQRRRALRGDIVLEETCR